MINNFGSLQHINQFDFQAAWDILSDNLHTYPESYDTKEDFINAADDIANQFGEDTRISEEDHKLIAGYVWDYKKDLA